VLAAGGACWCAVPEFQNRSLKRLHARHQIHRRHARSAAEIRTMGGSHAVTGPVWTEYDSSGSRPLRLKLAFECSQKDSPALVAARRQGLRRLNPANGSPSPLQPQLFRAAATATTAATAHPPHPQFSPLKLIPAPICSRECPSPTTRRAYARSPLLLYPPPTSLPHCCSFSLLPPPTSEALPDL